MNRKQKKILTVAAGIVNLSFTLTVAATATYAWFAENRRVSATGISVQCAVPEQTVDWEILHYNDDQKAGVSYLDESEFYLQPYDEYLTSRNKTSNVLLKAIVDVSKTGFTSQSQLYIDITCNSVSAFTYGTANSSGVPSYTSNISQFKASIYSYTDANDVTTVVNTAIDDSTADSRYQTASTYFRKVTDSGKFVYLHNNTPNKRKNKITLIPTFECASTIDKIVVYLEASYNSDLVKYYLKTHSTLSGEIDLQGDIDNIVFRTGKAYSGAYVKVKDQTSLNTSGDYMVVFDSYKAAFDGSGDASALYTSGTNYIDVKTKASIIANNENTYNSRFSYDTETKKLKSAAGFVVGKASSGMDASKSGSYENELTYNSTDGSVDVTSDGYNLRYNTDAGSTRFNYYNGTNQPISLYKYDENASEPADLDHITLGGAYPTSLYVNSTFTFSPGTVTATYKDGTTVDVTDSCEFSGYNMKSISNQTVTVSYTEDGITATATYTLSVTQGPTVTLNYPKITGTLGNTFTNLLATPTNFSDTNYTYSWTSTASGTVSVTSSNNPATLSFLAITTDSITITCTVTNDAGQTASATCIVTVIEKTTKTATYTVSTTTSVTTAGTVPDGSSAAYNQTYKTTKQIIKGDSATLTLSGYQNTVITGLTLNMKSNNDSGAGTFSMVAGSTTLAEISSATNFDKWYSNSDWSNSYIDVVVDLTNNSYQIQDGENITIKISATANSLYINSYTITYSTASSVNKELVRIEATPNKTNYYVGDNFTNPTITAYYDDLTSATIAPSKCEISGNDLSIAGTQLVTIKYTEGDITVSTSYSISIEEVKLESISISGQTTTLYVGDNFAVGDLVVTAKYNNNNTKAVTNNATVDSSKVDMNTAGEYEVTVTYTESDITCTQTYKVNIVAVIITKIEVTTKPTKVEYNVGDIFDPSGMVVTGTYNKGGTADVTSQVTYKTDALTLDDTTFTITYSDNVTTTITLTINKATVTLDNVSLSGIVGGKSELNATASNFSGAVTYTWAVDDFSLVEYSTDGSYFYCTYSKNGTVKVTVTASDGTQTATASCTITISALTVTTNPSSLTIEEGSTKTFTITTNGTIDSVISSNTSYATVTYSDTTATVTGVATGNCSITVTVKNGSESKTAEVSISVEEQAAIKVWRLITSISDLADGDVITFASKANAKVASSYYYYKYTSNTTTYLATVDATFVSDKSSFTTTNTVYELTLGASSGAWTFTDSTGILGFDSSNNIVVGSGTTTWTISIGTTGTATVKNTSSNRQMKYFYNNGNNPRIKMYADSTSGTSDIQIYKKTSESGGDSSSSRSTKNILCTDLATSYESSATKHTAASEVVFYTQNCANYSSKIQWKASSGLLYNAEALNMQSITLNDLSGSETVYGATSAGGTTKEITGSNNVYDLSSYNYFTIVNGSKVSKASSITINLTTSKSIKKSFSQLNETFANSQEQAKKRLFNEAYLKKYISY